VVWLACLLVLPIKVLSSRTVRYRMVVVKN
jgi:hypothetical protein